MLRVLSLCWVFAHLWFWSWWLSSSHWVTGFGMVLTSLMILMVVSLPGYLFLTLGRLSAPRREVLPDLDAAIVVTKTPSEPWTIVCRVLEAALAQLRRGPLRRLAR